MNRCCLCRGAACVVDHRLRRLWADGLEEFEGHEHYRMRPSYLATCRYGNAPYALAPFAACSHSLMPSPLFCSIKTGRITQIARRSTLSRYPRHRLTTLFLAAHTRRPDTRTCRHAS